jgi:hypothetical protein
VLANGAKKNQVELPAEFRFGFAFEFQSSTGPANPVSRAADLAPWAVAHSNDSELEE